MSLTRTDDRLEYAIKWFRHQGQGLARKYDFERRCRKVTPERRTALANIASTAARAASALEGIRGLEREYLAADTPWGNMIVERIEDTSLKYVARCWERFAITEEADAALRAAWQARWTLLYG